ncbi:MAG TPA: DUF5946 family protein [Roseiflexaceae bacterium]|nr:DUF5946 family protein [Roseiflexaceae bacterium]
MTATHTLCPGCQAQLAPADGPTHRYIGASPACWALYTTLYNGGGPPLAPAAHAQLLVDAYATQHPGTPSPQSIQSVAVHLLTLHGVLVHGVAIKRALWLRQETLHQRGSSRHGRYTWLAPPDFSSSLTIADIVAAPTPTQRTAIAKQYVDMVYRAWAALHTPTIAAWYAAYIDGE